MKPLIVVEHLEDHFSKWVRAEYEHAKIIVGDRFVVTNAGRFCSEIAEVVGAENCFKESILSLQGVLYSNPSHVIILDMRADKPLTPGEAGNAEAIVIGGILGDHPPRGRTWSQLTSKALREGMKARHLGMYQLSIDGAVYVAYQVLRGRSLDEIELVLNPVIEVELGDGFVREIELPFAYPRVRGKSLIYKKVVELLRSGLGYEEYRLAREG
jgi:ribosome biogenesis SPOUT family RNA methylase Rps3